MSYSTLKPSRVWRQRRLVTCIAGVVSLATPAIALSVPVTNCNDVGPNSLRAAVVNTTTGGTIDMTGLTCSTITLEDFQIVIPQNDLTIEGPARGVTIAHDGNYDRVLNHQGSGTLKLEYIHVTGGDRYSSTQSVNGGCIYSKGNVVMVASSVSNCSADTNAPNGYARGGGIFTLGDLTLYTSSITGNVAGGHYSTVAESGGAHSGGFFEMVNSSIRNNSAVGTYASRGGGVTTDSNFLMLYSTISGNAADIIGGLDAQGHYSSGMYASTVSGNHANLIGGVYLYTATTIRNSTIAFNSAATGKSNASYYSPGLSIVHFGQPVVVDLESSIIANNTYPSNGVPIESDLTESGNITVSGQHNLIVASSVVLPPNVVAVTSCPLLGPLRDNGGVTQTHALLSHSPAIDEGSNSGHETFDQRGSPYKRSDGLFANFTDIGAYEVQQEDVVFNAGFDGCPN